MPKVASRPKAQLNFQIHSRRALRCNLLRTLFQEDSRGFAIRLADSPLCQHCSLLGRIKEGSAHALDEAAQVLQDSLGNREFLARLDKALAFRGINRRMRERLRYLRGIPFRAILTVNFDDLLRGMMPSSDAYRAVLRPKGYRWWDSLFWQYEPRGATLVKLHGDLGKPWTIVFTRRGYRKRLYSDPAYMSFLRSVLAQQTVLYLGFSFADAYLNELRSEVLAMLGHARGSATIAYAVLNDVAQAARDQLTRTEGVEAISYNSKRPANYAGFDVILKELHERTNPSLRLSRMLAGRRILWVIRADYEDKGRFLLRPRCSGRIEVALHPLRARTP